MSLFGTSFSLLALTPLLIPPSYIAVVYLAERRWGQRVSGRLAAMPIQTTTVILIITLTVGLGAAGSVASGAILGSISLSAFSAFYGLASSSASWKGSITLALLAFFLSALIVVVVHGSPPIDFAGALASILVAITVLRRIETPAAIVGRSEIGLYQRMALTTALVIMVAVSVPYLGPIAAGTLGVFPVISTPMAVLNHRDCGPGAARRYLEALEWGMFGTVTFFFVLSEMLGPWGPFVAFAVALPVLVILQGIFWFVPRRWG